MTATVPAEPTRRHRLHALIEEARRRARRRRWTYTVAGLALAAGGALLAVLAFGGGGTTAVRPPPGFTLVKSEGPVAHAVIQYTSSTEDGWVTTNLATGEERPAVRTDEIWYDARSGLSRDVLRVDGRTRSDRTGTLCTTVRGHRSCDPGLPLIGLQSFPWPPEKAGYVAARGTFEGHDVIWLTPQHPSQPGQTTLKLGVDPQTHKVRVQQTLDGGRLLGQLVISQKEELRDASFVVPNGGAALSGTGWYEPLSGGLTLGYGFPAARKALGRPPFWLGPRFRGYVLRSVTIGTYSLRAANGARLRPAPFVRFYYAGEVGKGYVISVDEFGPTRPYFYEEGPRRGYLERDGISIVRLSREGLIVRINSDPFRFPLTRANALALARALRPLPPGLRSLPTLHEQ